MAAGVHIAGHVEKTDILVHLRICRLRLQPRPLMQRSSMNAYASSVAQGAAQSPGTAWYESLRMRRRAPTCMLFKSQQRMIGCMLACESGLL